MQKALDKNAALKALCHTLNVVTGTLQTEGTSSADLAWDRLQNAVPTDTQREIIIKYASDTLRAKFNADQDINFSAGLAHAFYDPVAKPINLVMMAIYPASLKNIEETLLNEKQRETILKTGLDLHFSLTDIAANYRQLIGRQTTLDVLDRLIDQYHDTAPLLLQQTKNLGNAWDVLAPDFTALKNSREQYKMCAREHLSRLPPTIGPLVQNAHPPAPAF